MGSRNSVIFDYPGHRLSLSILSFSLSLSFRSKQFFQRTRNLRSWRDRNGQLEGNVCTRSVKNTMENTKFRVEF